MNERILELAEQASNTTTSYYDGRGNVTQTVFDKEKFAELIVAECIAQCWTVSELESNGYVVSECSKKIRKHFGVEE
jgi:hypothetical protein